MIAGLRPIPRSLRQPFVVHRRHRLRTTDLCSENTRFTECGKKRESGIVVFNLIAELSPRIWRHEVVRTVVDHKLAIVLSAVLDGECPDVGVVGQTIAEKFRRIVQP